MRILKEWYGAYNSTLYLQDWCFDNGERHVSILYAHSLTGNKYEGGRSYYQHDLENETSELVQLIKSDFPAGCYEEIKQCVKDYMEGKEIERWN